MSFCIENVFFIEIPSIFGILKFYSQMDNFDKKNLWKYKVFKNEIVVGTPG